MRTDEIPESHTTGDPRKSQEAPKSFQGRLQEAGGNKSMKKDDLLEMVRNGADKIFSATNSTITDEDIEAILNHYQDARVVCREMIRAAHHGGGKDNITVVMAEIP